jgi:hypothetical protein
MVIVRPGWVKGNVTSAQSCRCCALGATETTLGGGLAAPVGVPPFELAHEHVIARPAGVG